MTSGLGITIVPQSIGRVRAFYGNFGVLVRALAYIMAHGGNGLRNATHRRAAQRQLHPLPARAVLRSAVRQPQHARSRLQR